MGILKYISSVLYSNDNPVVTVGETAENGGIESGSNANGDWTKFPDGTIIMNIQVSYADINVTDGAIFKSATVTSTLPATGIESLGGASMRSDVVGIWGSCATPNTGEIQTIIHRGTSSTSPRTGVWTIHGRWK